MPRKRRPKRLAERPEPTALAARVTANAQR